MLDTLTLTDEQKSAFERVWFIYGNGGKKSTFLNHKLVQGFVEHNEDRRQAYREGYKNMVVRHGQEQADKLAVTKECFKVCDLILDNKIEEALKIATS